MVIRMKATRSKIGQRRSHKRVMKPTLVKDKETGALRRRHFADPKSGMYRGRQVLAKPLAHGKKPSATTKKGAASESKEKSEK